MLEITNVSKDFDGLRAVNNVSLSVPEGQIIGLIGPNGSGKSTLINLVSGLTPPTEGKITFLGQDITGRPSDTIYALGLARGFQDPALFFRMAVLDNTLLPVKNQRGERPWYAPWKRTWREQENVSAARAGNVLREVNLREQYAKRAADLSGGQMKLLDIARCLMGEPKLMLLDEPTAGVAPKLAQEIFEQIAALRRERGMTFLIVEHRLELLFDYVDSVYVMHLGNVLMHGTPDEVTRNAEVREVYLGG